MRTYELTFVVDPRLSDEEVVALSDEYKAMIAAAGAEITKEESWGKRKLAYPINKMNEGKYVLFYVQTEGPNPLSEIEHRMRQNDNILRYLTVRTDVDLARAGRRAPGSEAEGKEGEGEKAPAEEAS